MNQEQTRFSWPAFVGSFSICLGIGLASAGIVSHGIPREFLHHAVLVVSLSLLVSIFFGYHRCIMRGLGWTWASIAHWTAREYIKKRLDTYCSPVRILSLGEKDGTVNLILDAGANNGIEHDTLFDVLTEHGGDLFGQVKVTAIETQKCWAEPINRVNVQFWEGLEDRMKQDVSPPPNMVAKRRLPEGIEQFLWDLKLVH
jgi:hypothetical protein